MLQSEEQNQQCPKIGLDGYVTANMWGVSNISKRRTTLAPVQKAAWLWHPCYLEGPQRPKARDKISCGPHLGGLAMPPLPYAGSPTLPSGR